MTRPRGQSRRPAVASRRWVKGGGDDNQNRWIRGLGKLARCFSQGESADLNLIALLALADISSGAQNVE